MILNRGKWGRDFGCQVSDPAVTLIPLWPRSRVKFALEAPLPVLPFWLNGRSSPGQELAHEKAEGAASSSVQRVDSRAPGPPVLGLLTRSCHGIGMETLEKLHDFSEPHPQNRDDTSPRASVRTELDDDNENNDDHLVNINSGCVLGILLLCCLVISCVQLFLLPPGCKPHQPSSVRRF